MLLNTRHLLSHASFVVLALGFLAGSGGVVQANSKDYCNNGEVSVSADDLLSEEPLLRDRAFSLNYRTSRPVKDTCGGSIEDSVNPIVAGEVDAGYARVGRGRYIRAGVGFYFSSQGRWLGYGQVSQGALRARDPEHVIGIFGDVEHRDHGAWTLGADIRGEKALRDGWPHQICSRLFKTCAGKLGMQFSYDSLLAGVSRQGLVEDRRRDLSIYYSAKVDSGWTVFDSLGMGLAHYKIEIDPKQGKKDPTAFSLSLGAGFSFKNSVTLALVLSRTRFNYLEGGEEGRDYETSLSIRLEYKLRGQVDIPDCKPEHGEVCIVEVGQGPYWSEFTVVSGRLLNVGDQKNNGPWGHDSG